MRVDIYITCGVDMNSEPEESFRNGSTESKSKYTVLVNLKPWIQNQFSKPAFSQQHIHRNHCFPHLFYFTSSFLSSLSAGVIATHRITASSPDMDLPTVAGLRVRGNAPAWICDVLKMSEVMKKCVCKRACVQALTCPWGFPYNLWGCFSLSQLCTSEHLTLLSSLFSFSSPNM